MYIASKSQKNSSNYTRFFGADVVFFRQTGCKLPNSGKNSGIPAKKQFANQINFHLYHYAGNNPVKYLDPDGNAVTNNTDDYIIVRLEDKIIFDGKEVDTIVLAPGEKYLGKVDGTRDKYGNYTKISAQSKDNIDYTVNDGNQIQFDNKNSKKQNDVNDRLKKINNLPLINLVKGKKLLSGNYSKESEGGKFLSRKWDDTFIEDLGDDGFNDYAKAYQSETQQNLRKVMVINASEDDK